MAEETPGIGLATKRSETKPWPKALAEELQSLLLRTNHLAGAERLYNMLPPADRERLGSDLSTAIKVHGEAVDMWMFLHGVEQPVAIVEVAHAIDLLTDVNRDRLRREVSSFLYEATGRSTTMTSSLEPAESLQVVEDVNAHIRELRMSKSLILVRRGDLLEVHWSQQSIGAAMDSNAAPWQFLWLLAARRIKGLALTPDWLEEHHRLLGMPDAKSRLKALIPEGLFDRIKPAAEHGYWLEIEASDIDCIMVDQEGRHLIGKDPTANE